VGGAGAALLLELLRGASGQPIHLGAGLAHAAGTVLGAASAWRWLPGLTARLRAGFRPYGEMLASRPRHS
jgi:hypothetical protein